MGKTLSKLRFVALAAVAAVTAFHPIATAAAACAKLYEALQDFVLRHVEVRDGGMGLPLESRTDGFLAAMDESHVVTAQSEQFREGFSGVRVVVCYQDSHRAAPVTHLQQTECRPLTIRNAPGGFV